MKRKSNFLIIVIFLFFSGALFANSDIDTVKQRVLLEILKAPVDDVEVSKLVKSANKDGSWPDINYEDVSRTGFENRYHLINLQSLCLAYQKKSSSFYHSPKVLRLVKQSLKYWCKHDFLSENWYHNQVSTPTNLVNILLLMDEDIESDIKSKAQNIASRANLNSPGARPGGDRINFGGIDAKRRLLLGDEASFAEIIEAINDEIKFNTGGRGMQCDYSFHHRFDRVNV